MEPRTGSRRPFFQFLIPIQRGVGELAGTAIAAFCERCESHWLEGMPDKLGISGAEDGDLELARALLAAMHENGADFTLTFRRLCAAAVEECADAAVRDLFANPAAYPAWAARWRSRLAIGGLEPHVRAQAMRRANPVFIPRNHRVEQALNAAIEGGDFSPFDELLTVLSRPYENQEVFADYANPPQAGERVFQTFRGT
jgi:serine/tyrosine/threonine adenylyltransferase